MPHDSAGAHCCRALVCLLIAIAACSPRALAQSDSTRGPDAVKLGIIGGLTVGGFIYGHALQSEIWWKGEQSDFHIEWDRDWRYALGADKLGHVYFPYAITHTYSRLLLWSDVDSATAIWSAASLALAYQTYIEIRDGFSQQWGFSIGDAAANLVGASMPVLQHYVPPLRTIDYKISFFPSQRFRSGAHAAIIDDYESTYHWLTLHMDDVIPSSWRGVYPEFIDLAIGHGVRGLDDNGGGRHELYLALDWNLDKLPGDWWGWNALRHALRHYHLPSPAIRLYPGPLQVGFHF